MRRPWCARSIPSVKSEMDAKSGSGKVAVEAVKESGKVPENQPAPRSAEAAVNPSDVPAQAPTQLNESASSSSGDAASSSSTAANAKDDSKHSSSSQKPKKKRHFHIPIPL